MVADSFKALLAEWIKIVAESPPRDDWHAFTLKVLNRWHDEPDVDKAWNKIQTAATSDGKAPLSPLPFIDWVVQQAIAYKIIVDDVIPGSEKGENLVIASAERVRLDAKKKKNPQLLRIAADRTAQAWEHREERKRILGRTGKPNPKRSFALECRQMLLNTCGQPLDDVVGMLASVVSGRVVDMRDTLKPTTKAARDIRTPK
jgi:hypothetical protein